MRSIGLPSWIERALGRQPRPVPPHVFAVRRRELRFAAFSRQPGESSGLELAEFHSVPLAEGIFGSGPLGVPAGESEALAASVRLLVARSSKPVREASVVLPDAWARSMVLELGDLPEEPAARLEVLRFRVKRMVPYRVEDLRIEAVPIGLAGGGGGTGAAGAIGATGAIGGVGAASAGGGSSAASGETAQCLVTLANSAVCALIEDGFSSCGIRVGQLSGATLSTLQALNRGELERRPVRSRAGRRRRFQPRARARRDAGGLAAEELHRGTRGRGSRPPADLRIAAHPDLSRRALSRRGAHCAPSRRAARGRAVLARGAGAGLRGPADASPGRAPGAGRRRLRRCPLPSSRRSPARPPREVA